MKADKHFNYGKVYSVLRNVRGQILDIVYPRRCPICDEIVIPKGKLICQECKKKVNYIKDPVCMKCGKQLKDEKEFCHDCNSLAHNFTRGFALFQYPSVKLSLYRFKYKNRQEYAAFYGEEIADKMGEQIYNLKADAIIPVPLHPKKLRERGYNQAEILADVIGKRMGIPVEKHLISRVVNTVPQKELNNLQRQNNLKKSFIISENVVKLRTIIIIDDIYTTGSTIDAMSKEFISKGIQNIYFITVAIGKGI